MKKRILSLFLALALFLSLISATGLTFGATIVSSGSCGDTATWELDSDGTLTISGSGRMNDYSYLEVENRAPWFSEQAQIKRVVVKEGVANISDFSFINCTNLANVDMAESVKDIGRSAFVNCINLKNIVVPNGVESLGSFAFGACINLINVTLPDSLKTIDYRAFEQCKSLTNIILPTTVEDIPHGAFFLCENLTKITIPKSIRRIEKNAFSACSNLEDVYYAGTKEQWDTIQIYEYNDELENATIHFEFSGSEIGDINTNNTNSSDNTDTNPEETTEANSEQLTNSTDTMTKGTSDTTPSETTDSISTGTTSEETTDNTDAPTEKPEDEIVDTSGKLIVYSDYTNLSIRKGSTITLNAGILVDGKLTGDVSNIAYQIGDTSILDVETSGTKDDCRYVSLKGVSNGTTTVAFNDSASGDIVKVSVTVYDNNYLSYTLNSVPTQNIEKYPTNVYNANGIYIDSYQYTAHDDQTATVSFDVYNMNYIYGAVEVYDKDGNLNSAVIIDKMSDNITSLKQILWDGPACIVKDVIDGDLVTYRSELLSKKTSVKVDVPKNGYIKISTDREASVLVNWVNAIDLMMGYFSTLAGIGSPIKSYFTNSYEFTKTLTEKLLDSKTYELLLKDGATVRKLLFKKFAKDTLISSELVESFPKTVINNILDIEGMEKLILDTAAEFGWQMGEGLLVHLLGFAGLGLQGIFAVGKIDNFATQFWDWEKTEGFGSIYIQNQGGGLRACQQIKVEGEKDFSPDTALSVFSVTLDEPLLDDIKNTNPVIYEAMTNGTTYTYNISLLTGGKEIQPDGNVTVYIPISEELQAANLTDHAKIFRVEEDGGLTEMDISIKDGYFVFETDHFSLYTVVGYDLENQNNAGSSILTIVAIVAACAIVGIAGFVVYKKKKIDTPKA